MASPATKAGIACAWGCPRSHVVQARGARAWDVTKHGSLIDLRHYVWIGQVDAGYRGQYPGFRGQDRRDRVLRGGEWLLANLKSEIRKMKVESEMTCQWQ